MTWPRGPAEITARLRLAFDKLSKLFRTNGHMVAGEDVVMPSTSSLGVADRETMALKWRRCTKSVLGRSSGVGLLDMNVLTAVARSGVRARVAGWK